MGRPSKYEPRFCELLVEFMAQGGTFEAFAGHPELSVSKQTLYTWCEQFPEFLDAKKRAQAKSNYYWTYVVARLAIMGKIPNFNTTMWIFFMKNVHGWRDKADNFHDENEIDDLVFKDVSKPIEEIEEQKLIGENKGES